MNGSAVKETLADLGKKAGPALAASGAASGVFVSTPVVLGALAITGATLVGLAIVKNMHSGRYEYNGKNGQHIVDIDAQPSS